jgi:uncharacterized protein (DUF2147 family)
MKKLKLRIILALASFLSPGLASAQKSNSTEIIGIYWSPKKDAKIEVFLKGQQYFGKFVWAANPRKDNKNPSKALQSRDLLGVEFLTGFTYDDGVYDDGEIYDPETGKTYSCKMSLEGNSLKVRGYIGISLFGRTEYFERIK